MPDALPLRLRLGDCARAIAHAALPAMTVQGQVHMPTVIAACARMAGTYMGWACQAVMHAAVPDGSVVLSADAAAQSPVLTQICLNTLRDLEVPLRVPPSEPWAGERFQTRLDAAATRFVMGPLLERLQKEYHLNDRQMAQAVAMGTGMLIHSVRKALEPDVGFGVAALAFEESCRLPPPTHPAHPADAPPPPEATEAS